MKQASMRDGTSKEACRSILRSADQRVRVLDHQVAEEGEDAVGAWARLSDPEPGERWCHRERPHGACQHRVKCRRATGSRSTGARTTGRGAAPRNLPEADPNA